MYYYDTNEKSPKRWAALVTGIYALLLTLCFWLVSFDFSRDIPELEEGILIDFGSVERASGDMDSQATDIAEQVPAVSASAALDVEHITTEQSDITIQEVEIKKDSKSKDRSSEVVKKVEAIPAEPQPRKVNTQALFPGRTLGSKSKSEGKDKGSGNQGDLSGAPNGDHAGTGQGSAGANFDLKGRSLVGSLPKPTYASNSSGKVVISVTVDSNGRVANATYQQQGSTTSSADLIRAAREAALKARFTESESFVQAGTITYVFRMK